MVPRKAILWVGVAFVLVLCARPALASSITFSATGTDAASITPTVNAFRAAIGGLNNVNAAGPLADGRREINWDGGGAATTFSATPFNGFQNNRGALFTTPGTGFLQAPPSGLDSFFGRADGLYDSTFDAFSPQRVFTPVASNIMDTTFFVPGTNGAVPATVTSFGAVFSDVDLANISSLQFFDPTGASLGTFFVPALLGQNTFSFLGVQFNGELIFRVRITTGDQVLSQTNIGLDQVVLDDFLFSEPQAVPESSSLVLLLSGASMVVWRMRRKQ